MINSSGISVLPVHGCPSWPPSICPLACGVTFRFSPFPDGGRATLLHGWHGRLARLPSQEVIGPCIFSYKCLWHLRGERAPQRLLVHRGPYQLLMRPCLGSQTGSFLQPQSLSLLWSQKKVISLREDFLGALPIFHTKSPGYIFHGRHFQIGWLLWIRLGRPWGEGQWRGQMVFPISYPRDSLRTLQNLSWTTFFLFNCKNSSLASQANLWGWLQSNHTG